MKKVFKSRLFVFILSIIVSAPITLVLAYSYVASEVEFTPSDDTWRNADDSAILDTSAALNNLYERASKMNFKELYSYSPGSPADYSYTITSSTKNVIIFLSSIRDASIGETDSTISLPGEAITLYNNEMGESYGNGKTGYIHARVYFMKNAQGTISGRISYRGSIKILEIN